MNRRTINEDQLAVVRLGSALRTAEEDLAAARRMTEVERDHARAIAAAHALDLNRLDDWRERAAKAERELVESRARVAQLEYDLAEVLRRRSSYV